MNASAPSSSLTQPMPRLVLIVICTALLLPVLTGSGMFLFGWRPARTANPVSYTHLTLPTNREV